jgi:hypothetical protein
MQEVPVTRFTFELTRKDFYQAFTAYRNRSPIAKWSLRAIMASLFGVLVIVLFGFIFGPNSEDRPSIVPIIALCIMWIIMLWGSPLWMARSQSSAPGAQGPRTLTIDSAGTEWVWNGGSATINWHNFIRCLESRNAFLLFTSSACFHIVPKRAFQNGESDEFRSIVSKHMPVKPV